MVKQKGNDFCPKTKLGKWSVRLNAFFLIVVIISVLLVNVFRMLSYDNRWWDITVPIIGLASITSFIFGLIVMRKEKHPLVYASVIVGALTILFIIFHSLFIKD